MAFIVPLGPFGEDDPRVQAIMEAHERAHAQGEDYSNRIWDLFERLTPEDLFTLIQLHNTYVNADSNMNVAYTLGQLTTILKISHSRCPSCGKDHESDFLKQSAKEEAVKTQPAAEPTKSFTEPALLTVRGAEMLAKYRVRDILGEFPRVSCIDCGIAYPSLADRMLRGPEDCHGCRIKAAHG